MFGYRYDTETGLYYLQSRYYNPEWGRFINADSIAGSVGELLGANVFAYCKNNFIMLKDSSGFRPMYATSLNDETEEMKDASFEAMNPHLKKNQRLAQRSLYVAKMYNGKHINTLNVVKVYKERSKVGGTVGISGAEFSTPLDYGLSVNQKLANVEGSAGLQLVGLKLGLEGSVYKFQLNSPVIRIFNVNLSIKGEVAVFTAGANIKVGYQPDGKFVFGGFIGGGDLGGGISFEFEVLC